MLNWNSWRDTLECLNSLVSLLKGGDVSLIVCDNASVDGSLEKILEWAKQRFTAAEITLFHSPPEIKQEITPFTLIQTGGNLGFAGGNNVGIRYALSSNRFDFIWVLNNDTVVSQNALISLIFCAHEYPKVGIFGSTLLDYYHPDRVQCAGGCRYYPLLTIYKNVLGGKTLAESMAYPAEPRIDYIYGAAMLFRTQVLREVGLLNEEYFLFYEELDYTQRLRKKGYHIAWCRASLVYHKGSASVGNLREGNKAKRAKANYYENLSTLKYTANFHYPWLWFVVPLRFTLKSLTLLFTGQWFLFRPLLKAYRDFFILRRSHRHRDS